jgi:hypothetical protein
MHEELFEKLGLKREILAPYRGTYLQGFNRATQCLWGFVDLLFTFINSKTSSLEKNIDVQFLVVMCKSVYNYIMERPTLASLGIVTFTKHLKIKYHNYQTI